MKQLIFPTKLLRNLQLQIQILLITEIEVVSIAANTTSIPISIQIKGDDINEGNETLKVRISTPPR